MRLFIFTLMLSSLFLFGCTKPWTNQNITNKQQSESQFEKDSVNCEVMAGEKYPLNKNRQLQFYNNCMTDKGWTKRDGSGIPFDLRKK